MCTNLRSRQNGVRSLPRHLRHISKMKLVIRKLFCTKWREHFLYQKSFLQKRINQAFNYFVIKQQRSKCNIFCSEGARRKLNTMISSWLTSRMSANFLRIGIILMYEHMYRYLRLCDDDDTFFVIFACYLGWFLFMYVTRLVFHSFCCFG